MQEQQRAGRSSVSVRVLQKCHFKLRSELNVTTLLPYLNKYHLITADFHEELTLQATHAAKVDRLVAELPRSGRDFLDRFIQCLRESVEEEPGTSHHEIAEALEEELKIQATRGFVYSTQITLESFYENPSPTTPLLVHTSQSGRRNEGQKSTKKTHCSRWWYCCYTIFIIVIASLALLLIILTQEPPISPSVRPQYAYGYSTVELLFDHIPFLDHIAVGMTTNCGAKVYHIPDQDCSSLPKLNTSYVNPTDIVDFIYMLPGSTIHFNITPGTRGAIWVFSDYDTLNNIQTDPTHFHCDSPPSGAFCFQAEQHPGQYPHVITRPAYYFIYLTFNKGVQWHFNRTIFDFDAISKDYQNIGILRPDYTLILHFPFPYKKNCVLVHFPSEQCNNAQIQAKNAVRQELYLIFPAIPLVICGIILIVLVGVHCHSRKNRPFSFEKIN